MRRERREEQPGGRSLSGSASITRRWSWSSRREEAERKVERADWAMATILAPVSSSCVLTTSLERSGSDTLTLAPTSQAPKTGQKNSRLEL